MDLFALTDVGCRREQNQDVCEARLFEESGAAALLVCDGMGGHRAGNVASQLLSTVFMGELEAGLSEALKTGAICGLMKSALRTGNSAVYELSLSKPEFRGMGTTVVAAVMTGEDVTVMNVGDSRAYIVSDSSIRQITRDHSVVEDMVERGDITREESRTHPNKNLITRAVGTVPEVEADFFSVRVRPGDRLLLCSDGLSNELTDGEILRAVTGSADAGSACRELIRQTLERGAPDNVTAAILIR